MRSRIGARHALIDGRLVDDVGVEVVDGRLAAIDADPGRHDHHLLVPGFVDLQVNGIDDVDVARARGEDWDRLDQALLAQGTTTWCPTLVTAPLDRYPQRLDAIGAAMTRPGRRPRIAGAHLEGPFLGSAHGAHRSEFVVDVDPDWLQALPDHVRLVTLGAEQPLAAEAVRLLAERGAVTSIGHTTATHEQCDTVADAGAALVTHLFNAMSGLHHRSPGVAAWALNHHSIRCSIIADGTHVDPSMLRLAARLLGPDRLVLVTDAVAWRAGGTGEVAVRLVDGVPRLADGTLAGSVLTMDAAVRTCIAAGIEPAVALTAATSTPARVLGLDDVGLLEVGRRADLVALDEHYRVTQVWVAGHPMLRRDTTAT